MRHFGEMCVLYGKYAYYTRIINDARQCEGSKMGVGGEAHRRGSHGPPTPPQLPLHLPAPIHIIYSYNILTMERGKRKEWDYVEV